jgi:hypothetical protein
MQRDINDVGGHEDNIDREVRKLIHEIQQDEGIRRRAMAEMLLMLNCDVDAWE